MKSFLLSIVRATPVKARLTLAPRCRESFTPLTLFSFLLSLTWYCHAMSYTLLSLLLSLNKKMYNIQFVVMKSNEIACTHFATCICVCRRKHAVKCNHICSVSYFFFFSLSLVLSLWAPTKSSHLNELNEEIEQREQQQPNNAIQRSTFTVARWWPQLAQHHTFCGLLFTL